MARVAIRTLAQSRKTPLPVHYPGAAAEHVYFEGLGDSIHLHLVALAPDAVLVVDASGPDRVLFVWEGVVTAGVTELPRGSSLIVERGASVTLTAGAVGAIMFAFAATQAPASRAGGHVHLMPSSSVPRYAPEPGLMAASGGLHADGTCASCTVWLHENTLPGLPDEDSRVIAERSTHCHSEDEIIVVIEGSIRLGMRQFGPGTAIAIAADTFYGFTPGPQGVCFINFRPQAPADIRLKNGDTMDEVQYWRDRVPSPQYLPG